MLFPWQCLALTVQSISILYYLPHLVFPQAIIPNRMVSVSQGDSHWSTLEGRYYCRSHQHNVFYLRGTHEHNKTGRPCKKKKRCCNCVKTKCLASKITHVIQSYCSTSKHNLLLIEICPHVLKTSRPCIKIIYSHSFVILHDDYRKWKIALKTHWCIRICWTSRMSTRSTLMTLHPCIKEK